MIYYFQNYQFDSEQITLYKDNQLFPIRTNEANLLALLLSNPGTIFSKQTILDNVWSDKVVAEQAVFQNISSLRAIFGEGAIKTFSRKGYQWQLVVEEAPPPLKVEEPPSIEPNKKSSKNIKMIAIALVAIVLFISGFVVNQYQEHIVQSNAQQRPIVIMLPFSLDGNQPGIDELSRKSTQTVSQKLAQSNVFQVVSSPSTLSFIDFTNTPANYFMELITRTNASLVLTGTIRVHNGSHIMRYVLQGKKNAWHGEFESLDLPGVSSQLLTHLERIATTPLLINPNNGENLESAQLQVLHDQYPTDLIIFERLIETFKRNSDLDSAVLLAEEMRALAIADKNLRYQARSHLLQGKILVQQRLTDNGETHLKTALKMFQQQGDYRLQSDSFHALAFVNRNKLDYAGIKNNLLQAASLARQAHDPLRQIEAISNLCIFAHKLNQNEDKWFFLNQAELMLDQYQLPQEHYAVIYLHMASFADSAEDTEKHARRILLLFAPQREHWVKASAQQLLTDLLIEQQRWHEAFNLFPAQETLNAKENYLMARIHYAQRQIEAAATFAAESFRNANFSGKTSAALDAALLLIQINKQQDNKAEQARYRSFIAKESTQWWSKHNQEKLILAGISIKQSEADKGI